MSKHTPGPWKQVSHEVFAGDRKSFRQIASCNKSRWKEKYPDWEANARLIAAAPEMLEALKLYAVGDDCWVDGAPDADNSRHSETCGYCKAMAAIAKAEGK